MKTNFFIAVNLPKELKENLRKHQSYWPEIPAKWIDGKNLHLTLLFLGQLPDKKIEECKEIIKNITDQAKPLDLVIEEISYGPPNGYSFIWANVKKTKELVELRELLEEKIAKTKINDIKIEKEKNLPHITLARINQMEFRQIDPEERPEIKEKININVKIGSIELMESILKKTGSEYSVVETFKLKNI
ncbi:MAG: RNA 2',3'-cyclic phosphodiesterase [Candidatus Nealsonbacteria bacterium]|nr:RNA 2',3'-cyclic phosphodiesterase [Candidatus Nealsonbacteria bacterium]